MSGELGIHRICDGDQRKCSLSITEIPHPPGGKYPLMGRALSKLLIGIHCGATPLLWRLREFVGSGG